MLSRVGVTRCKDNVGSGRRSPMSQAQRRRRARAYSTVMAVENECDHTVVYAQDEGRRLKGKGQWVEEEGMMTTSLLLVGLTGPFTCSPCSLVGVGDGDTVRRDVRAGWVGVWMD